MMERLILMTVRLFHLIKLKRQKIFLFMQEMF
nr:MAG TPA: hypothetical protein [Caudoviricetes sp.]